VILGAESGLHERRLLIDLLETYNRLERPVQNETEAVILYFGLTLQQIIDVVRTVKERTDS
jgi:nicotinic acetylcholine receptor